MPEEINRVVADRFAIEHKDDDDEKF